MPAGQDGDPSTNGIQRWTLLDKFKELSDSMKQQRDEYGAMGVGAEESHSTDEEDSSRDGEGRDIWLC
jgi:hypothetical protein